jgi:hypothetical protein
MGMKATILVTLILFFLSLYTMAQASKKVFDNIPVQLREKASVAFIGTFYTSRGASQTYAEEKRRWRLIKGFKIEDDVIGNIKVKEIEIDPNLAKDSTRTKFAATELIVGERYCVLLNLSAEKLEYITNSKIPFDYNNHLITKDEIVTIVKVK